MLILLPKQSSDELCTLECVIIKSSKVCVSIKSIGMMRKNSKNSVLNSNA